MGIRLLRLRSYNPQSPTELSRELLIPLDLVVSLEEAPPVLGIAPTIVRFAGVGMAQPQVAFVRDSVPEVLAQWTALEEGSALVGVPLERVPERELPRTSLSQP